MAKLMVAPELILQALFPDQHGLVLGGVTLERRLDGGVFVMLDITGPDVPNSKFIVAEFTKHGGGLKSTFRAIK